MFIFLIVVHVICCIILIAAILLQAGRGGGLTEAMGGDSMQSVLGTQAPTVLKKATTVSAVGFLCTSLLLGMVTASRGKSIFEKSRLPAIPVTQEQVAVAVKEQKQQVTEAAPQAPAPIEVAAPAEAPAPVGAPAPFEATEPAEVVAPVSEVTS